MRYARDMDVLQLEMAQVNDAICNTYFRHEPPRKPARRATADA